MQMLHPFRGSIQQYEQELFDPDRYRPDHCPLCHTPDPLRAHGFYCRTLVDGQYDGSIRVRRYLCLLCKRTVSLLPEFVLPYLRFTIQVIGLFLVSRLLYRRTLGEAAGAAFQPNMPYQRGQFWIRRFHQQATALCAALASLTSVVPARDFLTRALHTLEAIGWIPAHRFLFAELRVHGWAGHAFSFRTVVAAIRCPPYPVPDVKHTTLVLAANRKRAMVAEVEGGSSWMRGAKRSPCSAMR